MQKNGDGVKGFGLGGVADLLTTGGAGGGDDVVRDGFADSREESFFADAHREFVIEFVVAEGPGHTAASGRNYVAIIILGQFEHPFTCLDGSENFLMAMAVEEYIERGVGELLRQDASGVDFVTDKFVI